MNMRGPMLAMVATLVAVIGGLFCWPPLLVFAAVISMLAFHVTMADIVRGEVERSREIDRIIERARREGRDL